MLRLDALKLDGNLFARDDVGAEVDVAERAGTDLATDAVLIPDAEILCIMLATPFQEPCHRPSPRMAGRE